MPSGTLLNSRQLGTLVICLETILGKGDRLCDNSYTLDSILSYLLIDFAHLNTHSLLHQFFFSVGLQIHTHHYTLPSSYHPVSVLFLVKFQRKVFSTISNSSLPILVSICSSQASTNHCAEMVLFKVISNLHLAKSKNQV